ncbi:hypothetical protein Tsubulata_022901 [Turnera subulata]|uniref:DC1 domain-containing protein n=1 Tax=Turnera subulata TaxID=218843 RepID=A0A9Q0FUS0_9ROSI|nr:hypothetical protein Tsubulata_022901 [Turnera subulata]
MSLKSFAFTCHDCGTDGERDPYLCTTCQIMVHERCLHLSPSIRIKQHPHWINHTYFLEDVECTCGVCRAEMKAGYGGYSCPCNFLAHVACVYEYNFDSRGASAGPDTGDMMSERQHFSHGHPLVRIDEVSEDHNCDLCLLPIYLPPLFYTCRECDFHLDNSCAKLAHKIEYGAHSHPHPLVFRPDMGQSTKFFCDWCSQVSHGSYYTCEETGECSLIVDVRCIKAMFEPSKHEAHQHSLFLPSDEGGENSITLLELSRECSGCGCVPRLNGRKKLRCAPCDFNLDFACATLPLKVINDRYDPHPLFLTYRSYDGEEAPFDEYYCLICEDERDPKHWFYHCQDCDFDAHPRCLLGRFPYVKLGGSYTHDNHPHPLTLVELEENDKPACHSCGDHCYYLGLECTARDCNFIVHWYCFPQTVFYCTLYLVHFGDSTKMSLVPLVVGLFALWKS